jgi:outer membrane protein assembly factor BamB
MGFNPYARTGQPRFAYARGHLLVLCLNHTVYGFDLADGRKLWDLDLFGKAGASAQPPQIDSDADGVVYVISPDGTRKRLGQVGVVEASYVCLLTGDGLVALDPTRGTELWKKTEVPSQCQLFGDDRYVYLVEVGADGTTFGKTHAVRASDGATVPVPDFSALFNPAKRVRVLGGRLVLFEEANGGKLLRLYDVATGQDDWRQEFPAGTALIRSEEPTLIGALEPSGRFRVFDLTTRKVRFEGEVTEKDDIDAIPKLQDAHLFLDRERYYLSLNRPPAPLFTSTPNVANGLRAERVGGTLYAFDQATNRAVWWADDLVGQYAILEQFGDLPLLLCATQYTRNNAQGGTEQSGVWVTAIDKRTGKMVYNPKLLSANNSPFLTLTADPLSGTIELARYDLRVKFTPEGDSGQRISDAGTPRKP